MKKPIKSKTCTKCGKVKDLSGFSKDKRAKSGLQSACRNCADAYRQANRKSLAIYQEIYREENRESISIYQKLYRSTPARKESHARGGKKYNLKFPEKRIAVHAVSNAIARGDLERPPTCSCCGKVCVPEGHHWCYRKEHHLDVIWLCQQCHKDLHKTLIYNPATWKYRVKYIKQLTVCENFATMQ